MMGGERLDISYRNVASTAAPETSCLELGVVWRPRGFESNSISPGEAEIRPGSSVQKSKKRRVSTDSPILKPEPGLEHPAAAGEAPRRRGRAGRGGGGGPPGEVTPLPHTP